MLNNVFTNLIKKLLEMTIIKHQTNNLVCQHSAATNIELPFLKASLPWREGIPHTPLLLENTCQTLLSCCLCDFEFYLWKL